MQSLLLSFLGGFAVEVAGKPVQDFESDKTRALLTFLAVENGFPHRREKLASLFWPEMPENRARHSLSQSLSSLRRLLQGDLDHSTFGITVQEIRFHIEDCWLDFQEFDALVRSCKEHRHPPQATCYLCQEGLERAAALYKGDFLAGFTLQGCTAFEEWLLLQREAYRQEMIWATGQLSHGFELSGNLEKALLYANQQVALDSLNESSHRQIMGLLVKAGRLNDALAQYAACQKILADELGIEPGQATRDLFQKIHGEPDGFALPVEKRNNLPIPLMNCIGRENELEQLCHMLAGPGCRLVTIIGLGGIGKTRLAVEAGHRLLPTFPDGVYMVEANYHLHTEALLPAIARALSLDTLPESAAIVNQPGSSLQKQLFSHLSEKNLLLIVDSFENILDASGQIWELLQIAPHLKILITSRARLNLEGEIIFRMEGLQYPTETQLQVSPSDFSAVELYEQTAKRMNPAFSLTLNNQSAVAEICRLTQGMPLGIVLAASWEGTLEPEQVVRKIRNSLDFLSAGWQNMPDRQRSLRATFLYSWNLLNEQQRTAFLRLAIFPGSFSADHASQISNVSVHTLKALIDQSLLLQSDQGRLRMHDLLREFAAEKLDALPEESQALRQKFSQVYLSSMESGLTRLRSAQLFQAIKEMNLEHANIRFAWDWAVQSGQFDLLERAIEGLCHYDLITCRYDEGLSLCSLAEERLRDQGSFCKSIRLQAALRRWQAEFLRSQGKIVLARQVIEPVVIMLENEARRKADLREDLASAYLTLAKIAQETSPFSSYTAIEFADHSLSLFRSLHRSWNIAQALSFLAGVQDRLGNRQECYRLGLEVLEILNDLGDPFLIANIKTELSWTYMLIGEWDRGLQLAQELDAYYQHIGGQYAQAESQLILGTGLFYAGRFDESRPRLLKSREASSRLGLRFYVYFLELFLCNIDFMTGRYEDAVATAGKLIEEHDYFASNCLAFTGAVDIIEGRLQQARWHLERSLEAFFRSDRRDFIGLPLAFLSLVAYLNRDFRKAQSYLIDALGYFLRYPSFPVSCFCLAELALILAEKGDVEQAVELYAAVFGHPFVRNSQLYNDLYQKRLDSLSEAVPADVLEAARQRGSKLSMNQLAEQYLDRLRHSPDLHQALT